MTCPRLWRRADALCELTVCETEMENVLGRTCVSYDDVFEEVPEKNRRRDKSSEACSRRMGRLRVWAHARVAH